MKKFYNIEDDLKIIRNPILDLERYYRIGNNLNNNEIKIIENYISANGNKACLVFDKLKETNRIQIMPQVEETTVESNKEAQKDEQIENENEKIAKKLFEEADFKVIRAEPQEFIIFVKNLQEFYLK